MKPFKKNVSISLDEDIIPYIDLLSEMESRTFSSQVNFVVKLYVENNLERIEDYLSKRKQVDGLPTKW